MTKQEKKELIKEIRLNSFDSDVLGNKKQDRVNYTDIVIQIINEYKTEQYKKRTEETR